MDRVGLTGINFFGPDGSFQSYIDDSGEFRYARDTDGAEFTFNVNLASDRTVTIRVCAADSRRSLDELERDARKQLKRVLLKLGQIGSDFDSTPPGSAPADG